MGKRNNRTQRRRRWEDDYSSLFDDYDDKERYDSDEYGWDDEINRADVDHDDFDVDDDYEFEDLDDLDDSDIN